MGYSHEITAILMAFQNWQIEDTKTFNVSIKDKPLQYHGNTISPLEEQNLCITVNS